MTRGQCVQTGSLTLDYTMTGLDPPQSRWLTQRGAEQRHGPPCVESPWRKCVLRQAGHHQTLSPGSARMNVADPPPWCSLCNWLWGHQGMCGHNTYIHQTYPEGGSVRGGKLDVAEHFRQVLQDERRRPTPAKRRGAVCATGLGPMRYVWTHHVS